MESIEIAKAKSVLLEFMSAMKKWEECYCHLYKAENGGAEKYRDQAREELEDIYRSYLTPKDRKTGRMAGPNAGYPTEFDPEQDAIEAEEWINPKKIVFSSMWTQPAVADFTEKRRCTMMLRNGTWLLDKKVKYSAYAEKWINVVM